MSKKSFSALFEAAERHDEYWTERAIIKYTEALSCWIESKKISQAELAARIGRPMMWKRGPTRLPSAPGAVIAGPARASMPGLRGNRKAG